MASNTQRGNQFGQILAQEAFTELAPIIQSCFLQIQENLCQSEELLKTEDVCKLLKISPPTLNELVKSGNFHKYTFKGHRGTYYKRSEILQALIKTE